MAQIKTSLIKMDLSHYYQKVPGIGNPVSHNGKVFYDKFKRVDSMLTSQVVKDHANGKICVAHSLILKNNRVENIVFDYNGRNPDRWYHKAQLLLRDEGFTNFTAYNSKTEGHLHLYVHKGHTDLTEGKILAKSLSMKLASSCCIEWRMFPNDELPSTFNILTLPYSVFASERSSWSKHL